MAQKTILGVDFGMSKTIVSIYSEGSNLDPDVLNIGNSKIVTSALRLNEQLSDVEEFGDEAILEIDQYPERTFFNFKSLLGRGFIYKETSRQITPEFLTELFLKAIRNQIEIDQYGGCCLDKNNIYTRVGAPVHWSWNFRFDFAKIVDRAGFPNVEVLPEPLGIAVYHTKYEDKFNNDIDKKILICDMGAFTTDLSLVEYKKGVLPFPRPIGGRAIGGVNFDEKICSEIKNKLISVDRNYYLNNKELAALMSESKRIKERLNTQISKNKSFVTEKKYFDSIKNYLDIKITKSDFENMTKDLKEELINFLRQSIANFDLKECDISSVLLAGGGAHAYFSRELISRAFPSLEKDKIIKDTDPQAVIAKGLARAGEWIPLLLANYENVLNDKIKNEIDCFRSSIFSRELEELLKSSLRSILDDLWPMVSFKEMLGARLSGTLESSESLKLIEEGVCNKSAEVLEAWTKEKLELFFKKVENIVELIVEDAGREFYKEIECDSLMNFDNIKSAIRKGVKDYLSSFMGIFAFGVFCAMAITGGFIIALAITIITTFVSFVEDSIVKNFLIDRVTEKIVGRFSENQKIPSGGMLRELWEKENGLESQLGDIKNKIWFGSSLEGGQSFSLEAMLKKIFVQSPTD